MADNRTEAKVAPNDNNDPDHYYRDLHIDNVNATREEVHTAANSLLKTMHPDKRKPTNDAEKTQFEEEYSKIKKASDILKNKESRQAYDNSTVQEAKTESKAEKSKEAKKETTSEDNTEQSEATQEERKKAKWGAAAFNVARMAFLLFSSDEAVTPEAERQARNPNVMIFVGDVKQLFQLLQALIQNLLGNHEGLHSNHEMGGPNSALIIIVGPPSILNGQLVHDFQQNAATEVQSSGLGHQHTPEALPAGEKLPALPPPDQTELSTAIRPYSPGHSSGN